MVTLSEVVLSLSQYLEGQRQLAQCRAQATGDADYYSYSYAQELKRLEGALEITLNGYIDQRIAERCLPTV